ncbi:MAG: transcriptional regulator [Trueperaceae bacterium]
MNSPFRELAGLDRTLHAPPRLAILTVLLGCEHADFTFLLTATGLTKGNLASNLTTLETAALIESQKEPQGPRSRTNYRLTGNGRESIEAHWESLERLKKQTRLVPAPVT